MKYPSFWQSKNFLAYLLLPISYCYRLVCFLRRKFYQIKKPQHFKIPIIIVGNISVGGTGKTPLVIWLVNFLQEQGYKPAMISRGYKSEANHYPYIVEEDSDPQIVGDEALLLARNTGCKVVIDPKRVRAVNKIIKETDCNIIISDDGLQHYALHRDIEIAVVDSERCFGNGFCLPAGPLREPPSRLDEVDFIVWNEKKYSSLLPELFLCEGVSCVQRTSLQDVKVGLFCVAGCVAKKRVGDEGVNDLQNLNHANLKYPHPRPSPPENHRGRGEQMHICSKGIILQAVAGTSKNKKTVDYFKNKKIHVVAAIGNPQRFFNSLHELGLTFVEHVFPDHYCYQRSDFNFESDAVILMTEKDAVKCEKFADDRFWYLPVVAELPKEFGEKILNKLR